MSDSALGVVGDDAVADRLRDAGVSVVTGSPADPPTTERVVAVGQTAVTGVGTSDHDPLLLPVDAGRGVRSVTRDAVPAAVRGMDDAHVDCHPVVSVTTAGDTVGRAVWDVTAVTADAARISEYAVETPTDSVGQFRADGVTVATPAGSPEYARRVGGPVVAPMAGIGVAAPIAPFATNPDHWVLPLDDLTVSVQRDEATVALYVDGVHEGTVACGQAVTLSRSGPLRVAVVDESRSRFS